MSTSNQNVSVVLCTYNGQLYIKEQLESILSQTVAPSEIIICDDGSNDDTVLIVNQYFANHPQIKYFQNPIRLGYNKNFEKAITLASGDYIAISDQDDIWVSTKIERMLEGYNKDSNVVYCNSVRFRDSIKNASKPSKHYRRVRGTQVKRLFLYNTVSGHALMVKRQILNQILPFPASGYYDWWIAMVACCNGGLSYVDDILVYQRVHDRNQSIKTRPNDAKSLDYKREVFEQLQTVSLIPNISAQELGIAQRFAGYLQRSFRGEGSFKLFFFIIRYAKSLFYRKPRLIPFPTWIKNAYLFSFIHE
jgi:glycosyltransferase involved in cell wall biosynthesis